MTASPVQKKTSVAFTKLSTRPVGLAVCSSHHAATVSSGFAWR